MIALLNSLKSSPSAEHRLILAHLSHVRRLVRRHGQHLSREDRQELLSAAMVGLIEAAARFDTAERTQFWAYAKNRVQGAVLDELRQKDPLTRTQRRQVRLVETSVAAQLAAGGERPRPEALSTLTGLSEERLLKVQGLRMAARTVTFSSLEIDGEGGVLETVADEGAPQPEALCQRQDQLRLLGAWVAQLPERERRVVDGIYFRRTSPRDLAREMSLTEGRISQIHHHGLELLRQRARIEGEAA